MLLALWDVRSVSQLLLLCFNSSNLAPDNMQEMGVLRAKETSFTKQAAHCIWPIGHGLLTPDLG